MDPNKQQGLWRFFLYLSILAVVLASSLQLSKHFPVGPAISTRPGPSHFRNPSHLNPKFLPQPSRKELIFDPVLVYSTLLGGTSNNTGGNPQSQEVAAIFVDSSGNLYVAGSTNGSDFPVTPGVVGPANPNSNYVGFLSKLDPTGHLIFSTYLFGMTIGSAVAVDPSNGNIIVAGQSIASDKPTPLPIPTGTTPFNASASDISVVRLNSTATAILNATYVGGSGANAAFDQLSGMAVDSTGNVYVVGATTSKDFPTLNPLQGALGNTEQDMFVTKMNPNLSALVYSTYLGQNTFVEAPQTTVGTASHGIAVDTSGNAYVVGVATSGFPTTSGALQATCTADCAFMAKLNPAGSALVYATYLGGNFSLNGFEFNVNAVAVDASQNVFLAGGLWAPGFATVNSLAPCTSGPAVTSGNGFVSEINAAGTLTFSTCLGQFQSPTIDSESYFGVTDMVLDVSGNVYVAGMGTGQLPLTNPIQSTLPDNAGVFVAAIDPNTPSLLFSSLLAPGQTGLSLGRGVLGGNSPNAVGVDGNQNIYVAGLSWGEDVPISLPVFNALQAAPVVPTSESYSDGFVLQIAPTDAAAAAAMPGSLVFNGQAIGTPSPAQTVTLTDMGSAALTVASVIVTGDFSVENGCTSVAAAGGTCSIQVVFTPTAMGNRTGTLTITDSSAGSPHAIPLMGAIGLVTAIFSPATLSFPTTAVNSNFAQMATLTDSGKLPLVISNIQVSGPFSQSGCGTYLPSGGSCQMQVQFNPTTSGPATGAITLTDNAAGSPQALALTGTGAINLGLAIHPSQSNQIDVTAGQTGMLLLDVGGAGTAGTVTFTCTGVPQGAACSVTPSSTSISATSSTSVQLSVTTTARSALPRFFTQRIPPWLWALASLTALLLFRAALAQPSLRLRWRFVPILALGVCGCGGGGASSGSGGTPAGTYTLVVTGQSGSVGQSLDIPLTVN